MAVQQKLADVHRRLKRLNKKNNRRRKAKQVSHSYETLELRRLLAVNVAPVGQNDLLYTTDVDAVLTIDQFEDGLLANDYDLDAELGGGGTGGGMGGGGGGYNGPLFAESLPTATTAGGALAQWYSLYPPLGGSGDSPGRV